MATRTYSNPAIAAIRRNKHKFKILGTEISSSSENITSRVADELIRQIDERYDEFAQQHEEDKQDRTRHIYKSHYGDGWTVNVVGPQVIYDEFGTGDAGEIRPHPEKNKYGLKPYNSGQKIKLSKNGTHYWRYIKDGKVITSHGVEAGLFVYNSFIDVSETKATMIALEDLHNDIKKVMKG